MNCSLAIKLSWTVYFCYVKLINYVNEMKRSFYFWAIFLFQILYRETVTTKWVIFRPVVTAALLSLK